MIKIKVTDAIIALEDKRTLLEQEIKEAKEEAKAAAAADVAFKKAIIKRINKSVEITPEAISSFVSWRSQKPQIELRMSFDVPDDLVMPEGPWVFQNKVNEASAALADVQELLKFLHLAASETVTVSTGVFKRLAQYL